MRFSILDVVLVAIFLAAAIVGGALGVLSKELVAAIITAAVAFLAARGKALFDKDKSDDEKKALDEGKRDEPEEKPEGHGDGAAPDKPLEPGHSHRIIVGDDGTIKVEDVTPPAGVPPVDVEPKDEE